VPKLDTVEPLVLNICHVYCYFLPCLNVFISVLSVILGQLSLVSVITNSQFLSSESERISLLVPTLALFCCVFLELKWWRRHCSMQLWCFNAAITAHFIHVTALQFTLKALTSAYFLTETTINMHEKLMITGGSNFDFFSITNRFKSSTSSVVISRPRSPVQSLDMCVLALCSATYSKLI